MTESDQDDYVNRLAKGTSELFRIAGRSEDADRVIAIFSGDRAKAFFTNLDEARAVDAKRAPSAHHLQVEISFIATLEDEGVKNIPGAVMSINRDFKPHDDGGAPRKH